MSGPAPSPIPRPAHVPQRAPRRWRRAAAALATAVALAACGGSGGDGPAPAAGTDVDWVRSVMTDLYLYADRVAIDGKLAAASDAAGALEALRVNPPDRFSYVEQRARYDGFFDEGTSVGLGIGFRLETDAAALRFVQPDSPAGRAGLRRGDRIVAVDGVPAATLIAEARFTPALGPAEAGVTVALGIERAGVRSEATLTKAAYAVSPVLAKRAIASNGTTVGYVVLYTFTEPTRAAWAEAIAELRAAGATRLVVDLRDNGGGRLFVAADVAGSMAPASAVGQTFTELRHNALRTRDDLAILIPPHPAAGAFERVVFLTSAATCSAAESLIAGLRPFRADAVVGSLTCGKPVGFEPRTRGDLVLSAVSFTGRNRDGFGDWFDGLAPTCRVDAEPLVAFGDEADPRLAEALRWLATGACSAPAAGGAQAKAAAPREAGRWTGLASETGLH